MLLHSRIAAEGADMDAGIDAGRRDHCAIDDQRDRGYGGCGTVGSRGGGGAASVGGDGGGDEVWSVCGDGDGGGAGDDGMNAVRVRGSGRGAHGDGVNAGRARGGGVVVDGDACEAERVRGSGASGSASDHGARELLCQCRAAGHFGVVDGDEVWSVCGDGDGGGAHGDGVNAGRVRGGGVVVDGDACEAERVRGGRTGGNASDHGACELLRQCRAAAHFGVGDKHPREECSDDATVAVSAPRGDGRSAMKTKRLKQLQQECANSTAMAGDDDDLLGFLDVGRERENRMYGKVAAVRISPAHRHLPEGNSLDMRAIAHKATVSVKRSFALRERVTVNAVINEKIDIVSDEDDLLKHLDATSEMENTGRPNTLDEDMDNDCSGSIAVVGHRNTHEELNIPDIARAVLSALKYRDALAAEKSAYQRSRPDGAEEGATALQGNSYLSSHRERNRERRQSEHRKHSMFGPVSDNDRAKALERLQEALGPAGLEECVCVSCDELVLRRDALRKEASDRRFMNRMRRCLGGADETLPQLLIDAYSAPVSIPYLRHVLVAPNSFRRYMDQGDHPTAWFTICKSCNKEIERGRMPKFAISNGFIIGALPEELTGLTIPERIMTQLVTIGAMTRVMRGGCHRCIRSHCIAFDCTPGPPVTLLPRSISEVSEFRVAIVGELTEAQMEKVKGLHQIRTRMLSGAYDFYTRNNNFYSDVSRNDAVLTGDIDYELFEHLILEHIADEADVVDDSVREELENVRGHSDGWHVMNAHDELSIVERRIGLSDAAKELLSVKEILAQSKSTIRRGPGHST
jgi:hypothetical protein